MMLRVRVTPKAAHDAIDGIEATADGPAFKVRVKAVPEGGAANTAVAALVADWLGLAKRSVTLVGGVESRIKTLAIAGDTARLAAVLAGKLAGLQRKKDN